MRLIKRERSCMMLTNSVSPALFLVAEMTGRSVKLFSKNSHVFTYIQDIHLDEYDGDHT